MKTSAQANKVIFSLKKGKQPAKNTKKWVLESLEQSLIICFSQTKGWILDPVKLAEIEAI
jgi:hypothetical protein